MPSIDSERNGSDWVVKSYTLVEPLAMDGCREGYRTPLRLLLFLANPLRCGSARTLLKSRGTSKV